MDAELLNRMACPACRAGRLRSEGFELACAECEARYPLTDGIPVLLPEDGGSWKDEQAAFFDATTGAEFETTRPHGTPALYEWLMREKFRRSLFGIKALVPGAWALGVCGGSGMDGEFLARVGARVVVADISLGAAQRTVDRARRFGVDLIPVVADIERLPFHDRSFQLVYVHDGLHHLEDPLVGLREMARVAQVAVSVTEPADAVVTALAVRLGLALEREEAGNRVGRMRLTEIRAELEARGFRLLFPHRYAMYYAHEPGRVIRLLSRPGFVSLVAALFRLGNRVLGRYGNKLTVQAIRAAEPARKHRGASASPQGRRAVRRTGPATPVPADRRRGPRPHAE